jgi:glucokinase
LSFKVSTTRLLGDIGATHARFALLCGGEVARTQILLVGDYDRIEDAIHAYLSEIPANEKPADAALAVAGPVIGDSVVMMNSPWGFSIAGMRQHFGWSKLYVINDFAANALAVPELPAENLLQIGDGAKVEGTPIAVLGPGTGLGVGGLVPSPSGWIAVAGEGGNVTLPALDSREAAIIDILRRQYAHVSAEIVLSGPGLVNLYDALCELAGKPATPATPEHITNLYPGCDPLCREAVVIFCAMLGTFAGDVALTFGARGGVYIMGGIVPKIYEVFRHSHFRERFEFKGRYRQYLSTVPTYVVTHPVPAFLGLKTLFRD